MNDNEQAEQIKWDWDMVFEEAEEIDRKIIDTWRWGSVIELIFRLHDRTWGVVYRWTNDDGPETYSPPEVYEVEQQQRTITEWVPKKEGK